ncbi:MAG TPA: zinc-binding dehydrogenase [Mycobacteriales bacterium]|nr:zinc-binding dehydrogenase [Mycobacteriales bacterium]
MRYHEYGGPEVLRIEEVDPPRPEAGQVLIRTEAIGGSFVDTAMRGGTSRLGQSPLPGSPHGDVVGTVEALGSGVGNVRVGDRVVALVAVDAYADFALADADWLAPVPDGLDLGLASALAMPAPVALRVLRTGRLSKGETVLVHAASGGIGQLTLQLARLEGAGTVIATTGSAAKFDFVRENGADVAVDGTAPDWAEQVRAAAPDGVDVILDSIGGRVTAQSLDLLAPFGRLVLYGAASGELPEVPVQSLFGLKSVTGFSLLGWRTARPGPAREEMEEVTEHAVAGRLRVSVQATVPLTEAARAHELLADRTRQGRVLLIP